MLDLAIGNAFLAELAKPVRRIDENRLSVLLRDFAACVVSGAKRYDRLHLLGKNPHELAIGLGLCASADDLDDVDWTVLTHPGSIIWSVAIGLGKFNSSQIEELFQAAASGYQTGASMANFLGATHRAKQHLTATSGAFAATSAAATILKLSENQHINALKMTAANLGGSSQAGFERSGATQFNRVAAITLGITSAKSAQLKAPHVQDIWNGPFGLIEFNGAEAKTFDIKDGVSTTSIRLYPLTGFAHSALAAAIAIEPRIDGEILEIEVTLPLAISKLMDGSRGGDWWNPISGISGFFDSRNPFDITNDSKYRKKTNLKFEEMTIGSGKVKVKTSSGVYDETVITPPGLVFDSEIELKWQKIANLEIKDDLLAYNLCSSFPDLALR